MPASQPSQDWRISNSIARVRLLNKLRKAEGGDQALRGLGGIEGLRGRMNVFEGRLEWDRCRSSGSSFCKRGKKKKRIARIQGLLDLSKLILMSLRARVWIYFLGVHMCGSSYLSTKRLFASQYSWTPERRASPR